MARRKNIGAASLLPLILIVFAIWFIVKVAENIEVGIFLGCLVLVGAGMIFFVFHTRKVRLDYLRGKYGDESIVQRIRAKQLWQGQTMEQLIDSIGGPSSVDSNLLKTRKREVWKYHPIGKGRYRTRITLDNDVVTEIKILGR